MKDIAVGMIVSRLSYGSDVLFKVIEITEKNNRRVALLRGLETRLMADADLDDLKQATREECKNCRERVLEEAHEFLWPAPRILADKRSRIGQSNLDESQKYMKFPGRVLHLDGDKQYLAASLERYRQLSIDAQGIAVAEEKQSAVVTGYLRDFKPDLLVITGHDGIKSRGDPQQLSSYYSSQFFVETVERARDFENNKDDLIIFAGACQSFYEELIRRGANFASSPARILIHALDPLLLIKGIAFTSIGEVIDPFELISGTISGIAGLGGIESHGCLRLGLPVLDR